MVPHRVNHLAYVFWLAGLLGFSGLHRFYMGRWISGTLWLLTGGFCFVGQLIDLVMMQRMIADTNRQSGW